MGHFLHTYMGDGDPLPSFGGEPEQVAITERGPGSTLSPPAVWENLNEANKMSLFVRFTDLADQAHLPAPRIVNNWN